MGWIHGSEEGRGGKWTCNHGVAFGEVCQECDAIIEKSKVDAQAEYDAWDLNNKLTWFKDAVPWTETEYLGAYHWYTGEYVHFEGTGAMVNLSLQEAKFSPDGERYNLSN